jgi:hypothetical protein
MTGSEDSQHPVALPVPLYVDFANLQPLIFSVAQQAQAIQAVAALSKGLATSREPVICRCGTWCWPWASPATTAAQGAFAKTADPI